MSDEIEEARRRVEEIITPVRDRLQAVSDAMAPVSPARISAALAHKPPHVKGAKLGSPDRIIEKIQRRAAEAEALRRFLVLLVMLKELP